MKYPVKISESHLRCLLFSKLKSKSLDVWADIPIMGTTCDLVVFVDHIPACIIDTRPRKAWRRARARNQASYKKFDLPCLICASEGDIYIAALYAQKIAEQLQQDLDDDPSIKGTLYQ